MNVVLVGLGRIGKLVARRLLSQDGAAGWVGAVEKTRDPALLSYPLNYDSTYGTLDTRVEHTSDSLRVLGSNDVPLFDDIAIAIEETSPDLVVDCSGSQKSAEILLSRDSTRSACHLCSGSGHCEMRQRLWGMGIRDKR